MAIMPSGTQEQQRPAMEKPCPPVLLIGVTVNPDKGQVLRATALLSCISIVLHRPSCPEPAERKAAQEIARGGKYPGELGNGALFVFLFL